MPAPADHQPDRIFARVNYTLHHRAAPRPRWSRDANPSYAVLFVLEGELRWSIGTTQEQADEAGQDTTPREPRRQKVTDTNDGETFGLLGAGSLLLVAPEENARAACAQGRASYLLLSLAPAYVLDCAVRAGLTRRDARIHFHTPAPSRDERLAVLAREMAAELLDHAAGGDIVLDALVEQTTVHLLRRHARVSHAPELELSRAGLIDRRVRRAVELMHAQLGRDLPLEEIASAAHLSPFHFARLFKKLTGATPRAYLAALRAERARRLLAETDLSVTEIGARVGYDSSSHFAKAFRQSAGLSPRAFRASLVRS